MKEIKFTKIVASGNDFIVLEFLSSGAIGFKKIARKMCDRKYGVGADGLLVLEPSKKADVKMRIFNADGSEAEMCGNGARCIALYAKRYTCLAGRQALNAKNKITIETKAGIIESEVKNDNVKIKLTDPKGVKLDIPVKVNNRLLKVNFIDTGVPHTVIFVEGLDKIDIVSLGKQIRYHKKFSPKGTNADFVEVLNANSIKVRTYERGVEDETLACGTGAVASALLYAIRYTCLAARLPDGQGRQALYANQVDVHTKSGEILKIYFNRENNKFTDVWLEGRVKIVCKGAYYV